MSWLEKLLPPKIQKMDSPHKSDDLDPDNEGLGYQNTLVSLYFLE